MPGTKAPELNEPEEFVTTSMICRMATLVIVILAPLTTAPEGSLTLPTMLPVLTVVWANMGMARFTSVKTSEAQISECILTVACMMMQPMAAAQRGGPDP